MDSKITMPERRQALGPEQRDDLSPGHQPRVAEADAPRIVRAASAASPSSGSRRALPADFLREATVRLGWFALFPMVAGSLALAVQAVHPELGIGEPTLRVAVQGPFVVISALVVWAAWSGRVAPARVLDVALAYQVLACAAMAVVVNSRSWPPGVPLAGWSPVAVLVLFAPLVIPSTTPRTLVTATICAALDPLAVLLHVRLGTIEMPATDAMLVRFFPTLLAIPIAVLVARGVHHLGERLAIAREMGSYRLIEKLGAGGMGEVWRATHRMLSRNAAVKLIRPEILAGATGPAALAATERFEREAHAIARLQSPHTVHLFDYGIAADGTLYYVMELLDGVDLETLVRDDGPQPPARVIHILRQICHSLREAHGACLVHRDVKPANLFLCRYGGDLDHVKVLDFGLVRDHERTAGVMVSSEQVIAGTPAYLAPEMATGGRPIDARTDLYGVGCVAYFLLTAQLVFDGRTSMEMAVAHVAERPRPPSSRIALPIPPPALEAIVMQCLEKDPARRPASARELEAQLAALTLEPWSESDAAAWWARRARKDAAAA